MAIEAFENQIPKKSNRTQSKDSEQIWNLYCPSCGNWIGMYNSRLKRGDMHNISNEHICPYCGQAIDWEDCPRCGQKYEMFNEGERKMTNREWIDLLSKEFSVSRASARDMLHAIMLIKKHDNFKRAFDPLPNKKNEPEVE
jgi:predicted RNA-binding Zn-ribbon protein involved in translation (DUF1610 family)